MPSVDSPLNYVKPHRRMPRYADQHGPPYGADTLWSPPMSRPGFRLVEHCRTATSVELTVRRRRRLIVPRAAA